MNPKASHENLRPPVLAVRLTGAVLVACLWSFVARAADGSTPQWPNFNAVNGHSGELIVAVGNRGTIVHFPKNQEPRRVPSHTQRNLRDVYVESLDFAVAVGDGVVLRWDGMAWSPVVLEDSSAHYSAVWIAPQGKLVLYGGRRGNNFLVCPWLPHARTQPFCRHFASPMLAACGRGDHVQIVLASGEIHLVNDALIGPDGSFAPSYRPDRSLALKSAWLPGRNCASKGKLPEVFATDARGGLMHFDGTQWRPFYAAPTQTARARLGATRPAHNPALESTERLQARLGKSMPISQ